MFCGKDSALVGRRTARGPNVKPRLPVLLFCALLVTSVCNSQTRSKPSAPNTPEKNALSLPFADARQMTMTVEIKGQFGIRGSAVWVGKSGYLATCYHVVKDVKRPLVVGMPHDPLFVSGQLNLAIGGVVNIVDVTLVAWDESTDVAILKAAKPPGQTQSALVSGNLAGVTETLWTSKGATLATGKLTQGETMLLAGFPLDQATLILQVGIATGEFSYPGVQTPADSPPSNRRRIMLSLVSNPGNSGGPVLDHNGNVVGLLEGNLQSPLRDEFGRPIVCFRAQLDAVGNIRVDAAGNLIPDKAYPCLQNSGISYAVPAQFISDLAKKHNIDLQ
jgi:S1-C subfamily serine protease